MDEIIVFRHTLEIIIYWVTHQDFTFVKIFDTLSQGGTPVAQHALSLTPNLGAPSLWQRGLHRGLTVAMDPKNIGLQNAHNKNIMGPYQGCRWPLEVFSPKYFQI